MTKIIAFVVGAMFVLPAWAYTVTITQPSTSQAYIFPAQSIEVAVQVQPKPTTEHTLLLMMDGKTVATNQYATSLPTSDYGLGDHKLQAMLYNDVGQLIAQDERVIYVMARTNLAREREAKQAEQAAYDALPWYKKMYISTRQGNVSLTTGSTSNATSKTANTDTMTGMKPMSSGATSR